eukprot:scaffold683_cov124-Cylindrotheca_fusiformis.AAC.31
MEYESDGHLEPLKGQKERIVSASNGVNNNLSSVPTTPTGSERSGDSIPLPSLHGSLMRSRKKKNPHRYYEVLKVLGEGSMGSVSKVQKRKSVLGGSARLSYVEDERRQSRWWCPGFQIPCFIFCPVRTPEKSRNSLLHTIEEDNSAAPEQPPSREVMKSYSENTVSESSPAPSVSSIITYGRNNVIYALKSIHVERVKDDVYRRELMNEISILQTLDHPNIVKAMETFDYHDRMYLVLELCSGGDLYSRDPYDEVQACNIVFSIVDAVSYMHSKGITHRDLKYENVMFSNPSTYSVKLIDFGLSKKYALKEHLHDTVGTVYTMAPEVLKVTKAVSPQLFVRFASTFSAQRKQVVRRILRGKWEFRGDRWKRVSQGAKQFISELLTLKVENRPTAEETLQFTWLKRHNKDVPVSYVLVDNVSAAIRAFATYGRLKKLALLVVAYRSTDDELGFLRKIFDQFDITKNGEISREEFKKALTVYQYTDEELESMFLALDIDGTGIVHYSEFLAGSLEAHGSIDEARIADAFDRLDSDDSGFITVENLTEFIGHDISKEYIDSIIDEVNGNGDHKISYDQFLALWNETSTTSLKNALADVYKRRETFESSEDLDMDLSRSSSYDSDGMDQSGLSSTTDFPQGKGGYFFAVEKEKSMRGVWL